MSRDCRACPLREGASQVVWGVGPKDAELMIIGEAPGREEDAQGVPFIGKSGRLVDRALGMAGIDREDVYITNAVKCYPAGSPTEEALETCSQHLQAEIGAVRPRIILALGKWALLSLGLRKKGIVDKIGREYKTKYGRVISNVHPAFILRPTGRYKQNEFLAVFDTIAAELYGTCETEFIVVESMEQVNWLLGRLHEQKLFAFDTETTGLDPHESEIMGFSFSWREGTGVYLPVRKMGVLSTTELVWPQETHKQILVELARIFDDPDIKKVAHHAIFDMRMLKFSDVWPIEVSGLSGDTMIAAQFVDPAGSSALKPLAARYDDLRGYDRDIKRYMHEHEINVKKRGYGDIPVDILGPYAARDADACLRLHSDLPKKMSRVQKWTYENVVIPMQALCLEMEERGIQIDVEYTEDLRRTYAKRLAQLEGKFRYEFPLRFRWHRDINPASSPDKIKLLYTYLGFREIAWSKTSDAPKTDADTIRKLMQQNSIKPEVQEVLEALLAYQETAKVLSNYLTIPERFSDESGRVHPRYIPVKSEESAGGTVSGRITAKDPAMQTMPRDKKIRRMVCAAPGRVLLVADYSQMELRILAHMSNDARMLKTYREGGDIHTTTACALFDITPDRVSKDQRSRGKTVNFAMVYGAGPNRLIEQIKGLTQDGARQYIDSFFKFYEGVNKWRKEQIRLTEQRGYVESLFGRRRYVDLDDEHRKWERICLNHPIQSSAGDYVFNGMLNLNSLLAERFWDIEPGIVFQVYDSVLVEMDIGFVSRDLVGRTRTALESTISGIVDTTLPVDIELCYRFGEPLPREDVVELCGADVAEELFQ